MGSKTSNPAKRTLTAASAPFLKAVPVSPLDKASEAILALSPAHPKLSPAFARLRSMASPTSTGVGTHAPSLDSSPSLIVSANFAALEKASL